MTHPKWKYHRTEPACIVDHAEAEAELGEGWADTPAAFNEPEVDPESERAAAFLKAQAEMESEVADFEAETDEEIADERETEAATEAKPKQRKRKR